MNPVPARAIVKLIKSQGMQQAFSGWLRHGVCNPFEPACERLTWCVPFGTQTLIVSGDNPLPPSTTIVGP